MAETFKLPCSSYEELIKLFQAYANTKEGTALSLDEITQATGVPRTIVSKNNGFKFDIKVCLIKNGYPPQYSPEVFQKVMEQVENFEENNG